MAKDLRTASLLDFGPEVIASDLEIIALSLAIDPELQAVGAAIIDANILPRISEQPEWVLDELAWAFRLNRLQIWDTATIEGKRAFLVNIFEIRKKSGTRFAVRRVFDLMSIVGEVVEWFEEAAAPYTYRLRLFVDEVGLTRAQILQISELTHRFAPARSYLSEYAVESDRDARLALAAIPAAGVHIEIPYEE